ncbi:MAG: four helix bundle protein [Methanobacteriota archaeon]
MSRATLNRLRIWNDFMDLAKIVYEKTREWPEAERYGPTSQVRRAAVSVFSNIAEGHGRGRAREQAAYGRIARGSLQELDSLLEFAARLELLSGAQVRELRHYTADPLVRLHHYVQANEHAGSRSTPRVR